MVKKTEKALLPIGAILIGLLLAGAGLNIIELSFQRVSSTGGTLAVSGGSQLPEVNVDRVITPQIQGLWAYHFWYETSSSQAKQSCQNWKDAGNNKLFYQVVIKPPSNAKYKYGGSINSGEQTFEIHDFTVQDCSSTNNFGLGSNGLIFENTFIPLNEGIYKVCVNYFFDEDGSRPALKVSQECGWVKVLDDSPPACEYGTNIRASDHYLINSNCDCDGDGSSYAEKTLGGYCNPGHQTPFMSSYDVNSYCSGDETFDYVSWSCSDSSSGGETPTVTPTYTPNEETACSRLGITKGVCNSNEIGETNCQNGVIVVCHEFDVATCWLNTGDTCSIENEGTSEEFVSGDETCNYDYNENCLNSPDDCSCGDLICDTDGSCVIGDNSGDEWLDFSCGEQEICYHLDYDELYCADDCGNDSTLCEIYPNDPRCIVYCDSNNDCGSGEICFEGECMSVCELDSDCAISEYCDEGVCRVQGGDETNLGLVIIGSGLILVGGFVFYKDLSKRKKGISRKKKRKRR